MVNYVQKMKKEVITGMPTIYQPKCRFSMEWMYKRVAEECVFIYEWKASGNELFLNAEVHSYMNKIKKWFYSCAETQNYNHCTKLSFSPRTSMSYQLQFGKPRLLDTDCYVYGYYSYYGFLFALCSIILYIHICIIFTHAHIYLYIYYMTCFTVFWNLIWVESFVANPYFTWIYDGFYLLFTFFYNFKFSTSPQYQSLKSMPRHVNICSDKYILKCNHKPQDTFLKYFSHYIMISNISLVIYVKVLQTWIFTAQYIFFPNFLLRQPQFSQWA